MRNLYVSQAENEDPAEGNRRIKLASGVGGWEKGALKCHVLQRFQVGQESQEAIKFGY